MQRVLVTGATGNIGRPLVSQLLANGCRVRALSRNPESAQLPSGVDVVRGDLSSPATLDRALDGIDAVFLVWIGPLAPAAAAIERLAANAARIVFLTAPHRTPHPFFQQPNAMAAVHAGVEELIQRSGREWTFLRPHVFALNCVHWWGPQIREGNVVRWFYGDAATAPIDERDIAAVAVRALCDDGHGGKDYVITGPESLTQREQVRIVGDAIGRPLRFEELSHDAARQQLLAGVPPSIADMLLNAYAAAVGLPAWVTTTVEDVTGSPARSFRDWAAAHAEDFLTPH
jgi:uncharacterized protein YbjT (DUF2867 family)